MKPKGTVRIVIGAILCAWGLLSSLYGVVSGGDPISTLIVLVLLVGGGAWLIVAGVNARRRSLSDPPAAP